MTPSRPSHSRGRKLTDRVAVFARVALVGASVLVAVVLGTSPPGQAQPADLRTVTLRLAADDTYRAQPDWEANLRATVSAIYERNFQISFVILDIVPWASGKLTDETSLLDKLAADIGLGQADVVVAFIGVFHPARNTASVMVWGPADKFDDQAIRVIRLMRMHDFSRGVLGVDQEKRRIWSAIYGEGHARDEPNPLAKAIAYEGWSMLRVFSTRHEDSSRTPPESFASRRISISGR